MLRADRIRGLLAVMALLTGGVSPQSSPSPAEQNNLGVACMSQGKYAEARSAFAKAGNVLNQGIAALAQRQYADAERLFRAVLAAEPRNIRAHYNLGLRDRIQGRLEDSLKSFEAAERLDPDDSYIHYYLGAVNFALRRYSEAAVQYRRALDEDPNFVSAYFGLGRAYVLSGDEAKGNVYLKRFTELTEQSKLNEPTGQQYGEQGPYSLAEETARSGGPAPPAIPVRFEASEIKARGPAACLLDVFGQGRPDVFVPGAGFLRNLGAGKPELQGGLLEGARCAAGDFTNDGRADLAVGLVGKVVLYKNSGPGKFEKTAELAGGPEVLFVDFDHDGWLDLLAGNRLYRNKGDGTFADVTAASKLGEGFEPLAITDFDNHRDIDLLVRAADGIATLFSNQRDGSFKAIGLPVNDVTSAAALDYNNDGWMDLFLTRSTGCPVLLENVGGRQFRAVALPDCGETGTLGAATVDFDNDGFRDLAFAGGKGVHILRNRGNGRFEDASAALGLGQIPWAGPIQIAAADFDDDGATDLLVMQEHGPGLLLRNTGGSRNGFLKVKLTGLKDNRSAIGAKVEVRAGNTWQKIEHTGGFAEEIFGLGPRKSADFVRVLWPTGVLQDEIPGLSVRVAYIELDRKGGSCPILYAWDGQRFRFLSDIIGAGVIGEWVEPGVYDEPDPDEYLLAESAVPKDGRYLFRFTSQMEEVTYLDAARLLVVDHPAEVTVVPNEGFAADGHPRPFKLWKLRNATALALAPAPLRKTAFMGFGEPHSLILELPPPNPHPPTPVLLLYGWTEYYDSTSNYLAYHTGLHPDPPKLEVPDGQGGWRVALPSIGFPAGLPKWMVVNLAGVTSRRVRISTNMEICWQKAVVGWADDAAPVHVTELPPARADLRFLGYPKEIRRRPEAYDYQQISRSGPYAVHRGAYTRYGDVTELMQTADDRYAILASGDEVALEFEAGNLPPLPPDWKRTVIFKAEGFEKGMDFLIANPLTVTPLPLHPGRVETPELLDYRIRYNTRTR